MATHFHFYLQTHHDDRRMHVNIRGALNRTISSIDHNSVALCYAVLISAVLRHAARHSVKEEVD